MPPGLIEHIVGIAAHTSSVEMLVLYGKKSELVRMGVRDSIQEAGVGVVTMPMSMSGSGSIHSATVVTMTDERREKIKVCVPEPVVQNPGKLMDAATAMFENYGAYVDGIDGNIARLLDMDNTSKRSCKRSGERSGKRSGEQSSKRPCKAVDVVVPAQAPGQAPAQPAGTYDDPVCVGL
jgi:hypothetical protein